MNVFRRLYVSAIAAAASFASPATASQPQNRYEAGDRYSSDRTNLWGQIRDVRHDLNQATREQIVLWSREMEQNNGLYQKLCDIWEQYVAGAKGLQFIPSSEDQAWNNKRRAEWTQWETVCDLVSLRHFSTLQTQLARAWFRDGEAFVIKTYGRDQNGQKRPRILQIESQRVRSPQGKDKAAPGNTIYDGVEVNSIGRPVAYWGQFGEDPKEITRLDAYNVVHIFEPDRANQLRGIPVAYAVINDLIDLDQLTDFELRNAKRNADIAHVYETSNGEVPQNQLQRSARYTETGTTASGAPTTEQKLVAIEKATGGKAIALKMGEKLTELYAQSPSPGTQYLWDFLIKRVCAGVGISALLVWPASMQGTVVRADLDTCAQFFRSRSEVLANGCRLIYNWQLDEAVFANAGGVGVGVPADYRAVKIRPPRSPNVDVGRNSAALIAEYNAGFRTFESICGEMGEDWEEVLDQSGREIATARKIEKKLGLPEGSLLRKSLDVLTAQAEIKAAEAPSMALVA